MKPTASIKQPVPPASAKDDPLAALMFPGRAQLTWQEISGRLLVTTEHVRKLVVSGELKATGKNQVSASSYEAFVRRRYHH